MSKIRKDSYVKATTSAGPVYGKVLRVTTDILYLATDAGEAARVSRAGAVKITVGEYKANAGKTAQTYDAVDSAVKPEQKLLPKLPSAVRPGKKGTGKKADAIRIFGELTVGDQIPTRKAFSQAMAEKTGLSAKGASTYYYNLKSGRWTA